MIRFALILLGLLALAAVPARPATEAPVPRPAAQAAGTPGPGWAAELCDRFEATRPDAKHLVYVSWHGMVLPWQDEASFKTLAALLFNYYHFSAAPVRWREVPGSAGVVWWCDLREPGWTEGAWLAEASRQTVFTDVTVPVGVGERMRSRRGYSQDPKTLRLGPILWGPELLRNLIDETRADTSLDFLFSKQRFPGGDATPVGVGGRAGARPVGHPSGEGVQQFRTERRTVTHRGGDYVYPDDSGRVSRNVPAGTYYVDLQFKVKPAVVVGPVEEGNPKAANTPPKVDFPRTDKDWDDVFRIKTGKVQATVLDKPVGIARGAVVAGGVDHPGQGSVVARSNRWVEMEPGPWGWYSRTFDTDETAGDTDYVERAPDYIRQGRDPVAKAHEYLTTLPAGGIAMRLSDGAGNRLKETAPSVTRPGPPFRKHPHLNYGVVRNGAIDCLRCHLTQYGVISPADVFKDLVLGVGPDLKLEFKDPADAIRFRGFFRGLERRVQGYREPHRELIEEVTGWYGRPWTGGEVVVAIEDFVAYYDGPVFRRRAAAELGVTDDRLAAVSLQTLTGRPKQLVVGQAIPRAAWDKDVRPLLAKHLLPNSVPVIGVHHP